MSHAGTNWAIQQRGLKPTTKIVLWHLCDRFNPDYGCFPSQERLAHDCEISRATLNRHLDTLEECGLIRRVRCVDPDTHQQRPTRYVMAFEAGFGRPAEPSAHAMDQDGDDGCEVPCPVLRHGPDDENAKEHRALDAKIPPIPCLNSGHGAVSQKSTKPCLKNRQSRVSNCDTNLVREPLSKPVKEEEDAAAREVVFDVFFGELLGALGFSPNGALPGWWQGWPARQHVQRWISDLGLSEERIIAVVRETRSCHPAPPDGPKALDRAMERASRRDAEVATPSNRGKRRGKHAQGPRPSVDTLAAFYADMVNSDSYLPVSTISNTMRNAMLARGLVTPERLRERGV